MGQWSWARVIGVAVVYAVVVGIGRVVYATLRVEAEARQAGVDVENTYFILPPAPAWWSVVVIGPPAVLLAWRAWRGAHR